MNPPTNANTSTKPWWQTLRLADVPQDAVAGLMIVALVIPQGLAYALLAGLPAHLGLIAGILPSIVHACLGSSKLVTVGPAAMPALMTAAALAGMAKPGSDAWIALAALLALGSGLFRVILSLLRFGFIAHFLSQSVVAGFISGSAILIVLSQGPHVLGVSASGATAWDWVRALLGQASQVQGQAVVLAAVTLAALISGPKALEWLARSLGAQGPRLERLLLAFKAWPIAVISIITVAVNALDWPVRRVGQVAGGLGSLSLPVVDAASVLPLLGAMAAIGLVGFVESYAIAQSLAQERREAVVPGRELMALGAANIASGLVGSMPVSASFARSAANHMAGAQTPLSSILAALMLAGLLAMGAADLITSVPLVVLATTIMASVVRMIDTRILRLAWRYDRRDAWVYLATFLAVLALGPVNAIVIGVALSLALFVLRTSQPHIAEMGRLHGTEHFRNVLRHTVETDPKVAMFRVDESLYFANATTVFGDLLARLAHRPQVQDVVLVMSAVNAIDVSALMALQHFNDLLRSQNVKLHMAEIKGPVMDHLANSGFLQKQSGQVFLSSHAAMVHLSHTPQPDPAASI